MAPAIQPAALEAELTQALDDLLSALQQAGEAATAIRSLAPRLAATGSVLDEIAALVASGRRGMRSAPPSEAATLPGPAYTRPTLVEPSAPAPRPRPAAKRQASATGAIAAAPPAAARPVPDDAARANAASRVEPRQSGSPALEPAPFPNAGKDAAITCFRLEFESASAPLDLRRVDDAVASHPDVRDVALLDYDGRRATLKVWLAATSTPSDVQQALQQRAAESFAAGHEVRIVALEDVA